MIMKTKLLISVSILLACFASAMGQSSVWNLPESLTDTSIVREWTGGKYLVYSKKLPSNKITLHDNYSPTAISIQIPSNVHINDFRIVGDTVFAGGYMLNVSSKYGLIACFDINDMLAGSGTFHWMTFFQNTMSNDCCDVNYTDQVTEVKRIAPFNDGNGTCIAYIADNDIRSGTSVIYRRVGYGDVAFWGGLWDIHAYHYNKDGYERYTDIACTDNHIVVTAKDTGDNLFHFVVLNRMPNYANYCHPDAPDIYYFTDHAVIGRVMVTECGNDRFAVAYSYRDAANPGLAVKMLDASSGVPILSHSIDIPLAANAFAGPVKDIRYSHSGSFLWYLTDMESPLSGLYNHYIHKVDLSNIYAGLYESRFIPDEKFLSLDHYNYDGFVTSDLDNLGLSVFNEYLFGTETHCDNMELIPGFSSSPGIKIHSRHHCPTKPLSVSGPLSFTTIEEEAVLQCTTEE